MRPKQLTQFLAVCRFGSMSAAAEDLNIAQPALSKQIARLEHELQTPLFVRHSRGVTLTRAGVRLHENAADIIHKIEALKISIRSGNDEVSGEVTLVIITSLAPVLAVELYKRIEKDYQNIKLRILDHRSDRACKAIINREADLAIVPNAAVDLPMAESIRLFKEQFFLIKRAIPGAPQTSIALSNIKDEPLVSTFQHHDLRRRIEEAARGTGVNLNIKYETGSINVIGKLLEEGLASGILPKTFWLNQIASGTLMAQQITEPDIYRVHSLCWLSDEVLSPAVQCVRDIVLGEIQAMISAGKLSVTPMDC